MPHKIYKNQNQIDVRLQKRSFLFINYKQSGDLKSWNEKIAKYASSNPNIIFAISLALSAPLLHLTNTENIGVHFIGPSSIGKTTLLNIASSVWGNSIYNWRTTDNAAESIAELSNDGLLLFDELGQVDGCALDQLSYMLGNGIGKLRSKRSGDAKEAKTFRLALLSSGESGISTKLKERGKTLKAGQSVRLLELPADSKYGIFDDLHNFKSGDEFAKYLKNQIKENTGVLIDIFLQKIIKNKDEIIKMIQTFRKAWEKEVKTLYPNADGQVQRVIGKFSFIASAGEIAILLNLLPWKSLEVSNACKKILNNWINQRGGTLPQEIIEATKNLQEFLEEHGSSRFENPWNQEEKTINNRAGFRKLNECNIWEYYILPTSFNKIISNANKREVCEFWSERGILKTDKSGKNSQSIRIPGFGKKRMYYVNVQKLEISDINKQN